MPHVTPKEMKAEYQAQVRSLAQFKTAMEIALHIGVSPSSIRQFCKKHNIPLKVGTRGRNQKWKEDIGMEEKKKADLVRPPAVYDNRSAAEYYASL